MLDHGFKTLSLRRVCQVLMAVALIWGLAGCQTEPLRPADSGDQPAAQVVYQPGGVRLVSVDLDQQIAAPNSQPPAATDPSANQPINLDAARNEWVSYTVQIDDLPGASSRQNWVVSLTPLRPATGSASLISAENFRLSQVLSMPVDVNRAGYVRHTGLSGATRRLPRAMLPMTLRQGQLDVQTLRDPAAPTKAQSTPGSVSHESPVLWVDVKVPLETPAGQYQGAIQITDSRDHRVLASLPVGLQVFDFVMPDERHLLMVSRLHWQSLIQHYPDQLEAITPRLINRKDSRYQGVVKTMDQLISLAHEHRAEVVVPRLQPTVKWPAAQPPRVDWGDFDSVVTPWLSGQMFSDRVPQGYWPLPEIDYLQNYDFRSQGEYWTAAATHFDQRQWLNQTSVFLEQHTSGRASVTQAVQLSARMANILHAHPRIRVTGPLEEDQLVLNDEKITTGIDRQDTSRLIASAPGLIFAPPAQLWPQDVGRPQRWLRTDLQGLVPYVGAGGDQRDVRLWAWLAFLRQAGMVLWDGVLPQRNSPEDPADPDQMIWFYPGQWFGVDQPVPTIQLKWLRRAQQDYEYLYLASQRGEVVNALVLARLLTKPVQIQPLQELDPTYALMSGTADEQAWKQVRQLVARTILLREPGQTPDPARQSDLYLQTLRWLEPQERPILLNRAARFGWSPNSAGTGGSWVDVKLAIDLYNASDDRPVSNLLQFSGLTPGWMVRPQPIDIPMLLTFQVRCQELDAEFNLSEARFGRQATAPLELTFTEGHKLSKTPLRFVLPVAASDRREGGLRIDGSIEDWAPEDAVQDGPMVEMFSRPVLQKQQIKLADTPSQLFTGWGEDHFYLAFRLTGVGQQDLMHARNFVDYQFRRAWGEDLAEVLIQPIYDDNSLGPVLHVVVKPNGSDWVQRKVDLRRNTDRWQVLEGSSIRYASTLETGVWRGEIAIPWSAIAEKDKPQPRLLRFNFSQHNNTTGQSASWAGPVDFGRDDEFTGLLYLRQPDAPGMRR